MPGGILAALNKDGLPSTRKRRLLCIRVFGAAQERIDALEAQGFSRLDAERAVQRVMATMSLLAQAAQYQESMFTPGNDRYNAAQNTSIGIAELEDAARRDLQRVLEMV